MHSPSLTLRFGAIHLSCLLFTLLLTTGLQAQNRPSIGLAYPKDDRPVRVLRLEVEDSHGGQRVLAVSPCAGVDLLRGDRVRLRLVAVDSAGDIDSWKEGRRLTARFFSLERTGDLELVRTDPERGEAVIDAAGEKVLGPEGVSVLLGYELAESVHLDGPHRRGAISITIREPGRPAVPSQPPPASGRTSAADIVARLYRGILLREPDAPGAAPRIADIERRGYLGILNAAREIAASEESRGLSQGSTRAEDRLAALYENLLNLKRNEVDSETWKRDYDLLFRGEIEAVVNAIVRSQEFRRLHGYGPGRG